MLEKNIYSFEKGKKKQLAVIFETRESNNEGSSTGNSWNHPRVRMDEEEMANIVFRSGPPAITSRLLFRFSSGSSTLALLLRCFHDYKERKGAGLETIGVEEALQWDEQGRSREESGTFCRRFTLLGQFLNVLFISNIIVNEHVVIIINNSNIIYSAVVDFLPSFRFLFLFFCANFPSSSRLDPNYPYTPFRSLLYRLTRNNVKKGFFVLP